jgi:hypothetical protein
MPNDSVRQLDPEELHTDGGPHSTFNSIQHNTDRRLVLEIPELAEADLREPPETHPPSYE